MIFNKGNYNISIEIMQSTTGKDIIRIQDERNDFVGKCRTDEANKFIDFLGWVEEHEAYDDEWDEYIVPDEWELCEVIYDYYNYGGCRFDMGVFYGNFVMVDRIYYIQEAIREFISGTFAIEEVVKGCEDIEDLKNKLRQHDISTLMLISEKINQPQPRPVEAD